MKKIYVFFFLFIISCSKNINNEIIISEKKENIEVKEKSVLDNFEVKNIDGKLKYYSKILNKDIVLEDIFRKEYIKIINDIDSNLNLKNINFDKFKLEKDGIYIGNEYELFLEYNKYVRVFKSNIGFNSIYNGEKLNPLKREIIPNKKYIAFTYDDGPSNKYHDLIREEFNKYNMSATFFVLGCKFPKNSERLLETYLKGHEIQNHSYSHTNFKKLDTKGIWREILQTDDEIFKIIGIDTTYVRPPYGAIDKIIKEELKEKIALWSVDSEDWRSRNVNQIVKTVLNNVKDGSIVLFHDLYKESYEATKILIPILLENNYQFVTYSELIKIKN